MKIVKFYIRSPWFMTAGEKFGWPSTVSQEGIGLKRSKLKGDLDRIVEIGDAKGNIYTSTVRDLFKFYEQYPSKMSTKGTELVVFPRSIFSVKKPVQETYEPAQALLFNF